MFSSTLYLQGAGNSLNWDNSGCGIALHGHRNLGNSFCPIVIDCFFALEGVSDMLVWDIKN